MRKLLLLIAFIPVLCFGQSQISINPTGATKSVVPGITITNTNLTETSLMSSTEVIPANTLVPYRPYRFMMLCRINTPLVSIPTLTIKVKLGTQILTLVNGVSLAGSQTNQPFIIEGYILPTSATTQISYVRIDQNPGTALTLTNGNTTLLGNWTANLAVDNTFDITATWGGFTLGTANLTSIWFYRPDF